MFNVYIKKVPWAGMPGCMGCQEKMNEDRKTLRHILMKDLRFKDKKDP